ncbi:DHH family phosphoesterase [Furfurilactobacillus entadae]|uniref:DHH family phosphoesterase n=1 Tax=Furfurilactobacillus entadae TaxID=2922307 RepID=UPI0035E6F3CF
MDVQKAIFDDINRNRIIIIHRHQRPDPDAVGAQAGLARILQVAYPEKKIYIVGKQVPGLAWLAEMDQVADSQFDQALILILDTANEPRVDDQRWRDGREVVKIDHHPDDDPFGDLSWVDDQASSTSEMVVAFANRFDLTIDATAARSLYAGIVGDTGRFLYSDTTPTTMRVAAQLMDTGIDAVAVNQLEDEMPVPVARLSAYLYEHLEITASGAAYVVLSAETIQSFDLGDAGTASLVPMPGKIDSVRAWAIFEEQDDHSYRVRLRSKGPVINGLARQHNGGGHPLASGAKAKDKAEVQTIISQLEALTSAQ